MIISRACSTLGRPITLPHPAGLGDCTHTPLIGICRTIFACQQCPPNLVDRKQFQPADHIPVQHTGSLGGNLTHDPRVTILDLDRLASGTSITLALECYKAELSKKLGSGYYHSFIQEANISTNSMSITTCHLWQNFGQSSFASEAELRKYFAGSDFPPTVSTKVLEDKTITPFWYKLPGAYLQKQIKDMIDHLLWKDLIRVVVVICGDHGGGSCL
jgi:hypothetical protein